MPTLVHAQRALPWNDGEEGANSDAFQSEVSPEKTADKASHSDTKQSQQKILHDAGRYLSNIRSLKSGFTQVSPDGTIAEGTFYLQRPGKMRWQYAPPTPILMLSNGRYLTFIDYELEQVSHVPMDESLASFIAKSSISFSDPAIEVIDVRAGAGIVQISLIEKHAAENGVLTLEFTDAPLELRNIVITDRTQQTTHIALHNADYNIALDDSLFTYENPRFGSRLRR